MAGLVVLTALVVLLVHPAGAERVDPYRPTRIVVGAPAGPNPMYRGEPGRSGRVNRLPEVPRQLWQYNISGGTTLPVAVDHQGSIVVSAAVAEIVQISAAGKPQWHQGLGMSIATTGPVILSDGTRVVLTALGEAWGFSPKGKKRFRTNLTRYGTDPRVAPLPQDNGTVLVAVASHLLTLDNHGTVIDHVNVGERLVGGLVGTHEGTLATTDSGKVIRWAPPLPPKTVGTFKGLVREGIALIDAETVVAVVNVERLVTLNLRTGATSIRLNMFGLEGPPTVGSKKVVYAASMSGVLAATTDDGQVRRVALQPAPKTPDGGLEAGAQPTSFPPASPAVLVDKDGRVAVARSKGKVGVVSNGRIALAQGVGCAQPTSLTFAGPQRFIVACRTGAIRLYGP